MTVITSLDGRTLFTTHELTRSSDSIFFTICDVCTRNMLSRFIFAASSISDRASFEKPLYSISSIKKDGCVIRMPTPESTNTTKKDSSTVQLRALWFIIPIFLSAVPQAQGQFLFAILQSFLPY